MSEGEQPNPRPSLGPAKQRPIVGQRRALRYLMMFGASFLGAFSGYLVSWWLAQH